MIPIIKQRERIREISYDREFRWRGDHPHCGFGFPCDKDGEIDVLHLPPSAISNYMGCILGQFDVVDDGAMKFEHYYTNPAIAKCDCGHEIELASFTNTCEKCGRDYNMSGQLLADRSQWGEETGETASEILNIGHTIS